MSFELAASLEAEAREHRIVKEYHKMTSGAHSFSSSVNSSRFRSCNRSSKKDQIGDMRPSCAMGRRGRELIWLDSMAGVENRAPSSRPQGSIWIRNLPAAP